MSKTYPKNGASLLNSWYILGKGLDLSYRYQTAAELLTVKIGVLKKKSTTFSLQLKCVQVGVTLVPVYPGLNHSESFMGGIFAAI